QHEEHDREPAPYQQNTAAPSPDGPPENHQTGPRSRHPLTGQAALLPGGNGNNPVSNASINAIAPPRAAALNPNVDGSIRQFPLFGAKEYATIASRHDGNSHGDSGTKYPPRIIA